MIPHIDLLTTAMREPGSSSNCSNCTGLIPKQSHAPGSLEAPLSTSCGGEMDKTERAQKAPAPSNTPAPAHLRLSAPFLDILSHKMEEKKTECAQKAPAF